MERIGEYLIKRMVGEGGMGKVYEAEERLSKRRVALKVLRPELTRNEDGRRLFLNEMQILAHLEHPNIVRSLASVEEDGQLVMVLEFLQGRTLRDELNARRKIPWHEAVEIVSKVAEALVVAHSQEPPIIHRDLKPENVMLTTPDGQPPGLKVMDFGIAKVLAAAHATNTQSIGTLQYMSPEQIDARTIDARSDLYSLGLILYEMLAGGPPFHSASPRELLNMQCTHEAPDLGDDVRASLPRGVEDLLFALLEKAPADRPAAATDVIAQLAPFRAADPAPRRPRSGVKTGASADEAAKNASEGGDDAGDADDAGDDDAADGEPASSGTGTASDESRARAQNGDTLHSTPHAAKKKRDEGKDRGADKGRRGENDKPKNRPEPRLDTIALVERAGEGRDLAAGKAVLVILGLSIFAGVATYLVRAHGRTGPDPSVTATATASVGSPPSVGR